MSCHATASSLMTFENKWTRSTHLVVSNEVLRSIEASPLLLQCHYLMRTSPHFSACRLYIRNGFPKIENCDLLPIVKNWLGILLLSPLFIATYNFSSWVKQRGFSSSDSEYTEVTTFVSEDWWRRLHLLLAAIPIPTRLIYDHHPQVGPS